MFNIWIQYVSTCVCDMIVYRRVYFFLGFTICTYSPFWTWPCPNQKKYGNIGRPAHVHVHRYPLGWRTDLMCFYSTHICWTSWSSRCLKKGIVPRIVPDIAKEFHDFHSSHIGQVIVFLWHTKDSTKWRLGPEIHGKFGDRHLQMPYLHTNVIRTISGCPCEMEITMGTQNLQF